MVSGGSNHDINENKSQQEVAPRFNQKEIRGKLRSYYDAGMLAAEVIIKNIPGLMPRTICDNYKLFNDKTTNSRKEVDENL